MPTPTKIIHDCSTGIVTEVELTADEIAEMDATAKSIAEANEKEAEVAAEVAAHKVSGEAKLAELGLTADEIAALVG